MKSSRVGPPESNSTTSRFRAVAAVFLLVKQDGKRLWMRRYQTGFADGFYSLPSGHVEAGEPLSHAIIRETQEEIGITVEAAALTCVHVMYLLSQHPSLHERMNFFFETSTWSGKVINAEPHKCDDIVWLSEGQLPHPVVEYLPHVLDCIDKKTIYSEYGW